MVSEFVKSGQITKRNAVVTAHNKMDGKGRELLKLKSRNTVKSTEENSS
jgi:hypothetical protein